MKKDYKRIYRENTTSFSVFNQYLCLLLFFSFSAYAAAMPEEEKAKRRSALKPQAEQANCDVAIEQNGLVIVQAESKLSSGWAKKNEGKFTYLEWNGGDNFKNPGPGTINYQIKFNTPGFYKFEWRTTIKKGSDKAEHNDTWLKFPNNAGLTFFGFKGSPNDVESSLRNKKDVVFPGGTGLGKTPNGASTAGWFKVYINNTNWAWRAVTSDHDPHEIYVEVKQAGTYTMQLAGRSNGHAIDGMVLYHLKKQGTLSSSKLDGLLSSVKDCGGGTGDGDPEPEPTNTAPVLKSIADQSVTEGATVKVMVSASDKEGDAIHLSIDVKDSKNKTLSPSRYSFTSAHKGKTGSFTFNTKVGDAGKYTVTITAGDGTLSSKEEFTINVVAKGEPKPPVNNENLTFFLVDTKTNKDRMTLNNGSSFKTGVVGIRVDVKNVQVKSGIGFTLKGGPNHIKYKNSEGKITPYSLFGDKGVNVLPWENIKAGTYTLSAEVYGTNVKKEISFSVVTKGGDQPDDPTDPDEPGDPDQPEPDKDGLKVAKLYLIRANTNQRIMELKHGASVQIDVPVSIEAVTEGGQTGSVRFALNGNRNFQTENVAPYALGGDSNGNFYEVALKKGNNTIEATPFSQRKAKGTTGKPLKITFSLQKSNNLAARFSNLGAESTTELESGQGLSSKEAYPNPLAEELTLAYAGEFEESDVTLQLVSQLGVQYQLHASQYRIEGSEIKVDVKGLHLRTGVYFLQVDLGPATERKTYRLIKK